MYIKGHPAVMFLYISVAGYASLTRKSALLFSSRNHDAEKNERKCLNYDVSYLSVMSGIMHI